MTDVNLRLQRVEEEQYFNEQLLRDLNQVIIEQDAEIQKLKHDLSDLQKQFLVFQELLTEKIANVPPPHYLTKL